MTSCNMEDHWSTLYYWSRIFGNFAALQ